MAVKIKKVKTGKNKTKTTEIDTSKMSGKQKYKLARADRDSSTLRHTTTQLQRTARTKSIADAYRDSKESEYSAQRSKYKYLAQLNSLVDASNNEGTDTEATGGGNSGSNNGGSSLTNWPDSAFGG